MAWATAERLKALSRLWPLGIITGRGIDDAKHCLGFTPRYLFGNHGAERANDASATGHIASDVWRTRLDSCRQHVCQYKAFLTARGVVVEDKGMSLALHYGRGLDGSRMRQWLDNLMLPYLRDVNTSHGHQVMNITSKHAPDTGDALLEIIHGSGARQALMVGDDVNDECAFGKAPTGSVTVRVGTSPIPTKARFRLSSQQQIDCLLSTLLALRWK